LAVTAIVCGSLIVGREARALDFTLPIAAPVSSPTDPDNTACCATDGEPAWSFAWWNDDDGNTTGVQAHVVFDLGRTTDVSQIKMVGRGAYGLAVNPKDVDFYYFADNDPFNNAVADDIENDDDIVLVQNHAFGALPNGASEAVAVTGLSTRYVGMRINTSYGTNPQSEVGDMWFETPGAAPLVSPSLDYHSEPSTNPGYCVDGDFGTSALFNDDDAMTDGVQGHLIFDLGAAEYIGGFKIKAGRSGDRVNPEDVEFFYFADDDPTNNSGDLDDIEGDPDIRLLQSHTFDSLPSLTCGHPEFVYFGYTVEARYLGMRVNSSYGTSNFQLSEAHIFVTDDPGTPPPPLLPGDANNDRIVDDLDASILAAHWQQTGMNWDDGDFNGDGVVNDQDAAIMAAHWLETTEGAAPVPEPGPIVLLLGGLLSMLLWRRK
jgi:hypothetical protein